MVGSVDLTANGISSISPSSSFHVVKRHQSRPVYDDHCEDSEMIVTPRRDKGKGKMRYLPELPEEVWQRVWAFYYGQCAEEWTTEAGTQCALTPLLLSSEHTRIAFPVFYAHPLVTYKAIPSFIQAISTPTPWFVNNNPPSILVRHLTVCASSPPAGLNPGVTPRPAIIHQALPQLFASLPRLLSVYLKDTLVLHSTDANILFYALQQIQPSKARIEFRMWDLTESPFGPDLIAATRPSIHANMTRAPSPWSDDRPAPRMTPGLDVGRYAMQEQWRDALWRGVELDLPAWWIEIPKAQTNAVGPPVAAAGVQGGMFQGFPGLIVAQLAHAHAAALANAQANAAPGLGNAGGAGGGGSSHMGSGGGGGASAHGPSQGITGVNALGDVGNLQLPAYLQPPTAAYVAWVAQFDPTDVEQYQQNLLVSTTSDAGLDSDAEDLPSPAEEENADDALSDISSSADSADTDAQLTKLERQIHLAEQQQLLHPTSQAGTTSSSSMFAAVQPVLNGLPTPLSQASASSVSLASQVVDADDAAGIPLVNDAHANAHHWYDPGQPAANQEANGEGGSGASIKGFRATPNVDPSASSAQLAGPPASGSSADPAPTAQLDQSSTNTHSSASGGLHVVASTRLHQSHMNDASSRDCRRDHIPDGLNLSPTPVPPPAPAAQPTIIQIDAGRYQTPGQVTFHLAHTMRRQLLRLITEHWSPTIQALSVVAFDPLATLILRAPAADLWASVPVPHVRVHLPRGINSLAVFKGAVENARDRQRPRAASTGAQGTVVEEASPDLTGEEAHRIVGGDGFGMGLVNDETRLFEIEVNTIKEMGDEMWERAGDQLPPQLCRILVGEAGSGWDGVSWGPGGGSGSSSARGGGFGFAASEGGHEEGEEDADMTSEAGESSGEDDYYLTDGQDVDMERDDDGETYDRAAAEEQERRVMERKAARLRVEDTMEG